MRVLICAFGTKGDVYPLVGIAVELKRRGHDVVLLANRAFESLACETGLGFESVGTADELAKLGHQPGAWSYKDGWKVWIRGCGLAPMRQLFETIEKLHQPGNTVLAASYLGFGARLAQERLGIPLATLHLNVHTVWSLYDIFAYPPPSFWPEWMPPRFIPGSVGPLIYRQSTLWLADRLWIDRVMSQDINRFRADLGLGQLDQPVRRWWNSPDRAIGLYPGWWAGEHPDWPPQMVTTGFPFWDRSESHELSGELEEFLGTERNVVVYTPGASAGHSSERFEAFSEACRATGCRALVMTSALPGTHSAGDSIRYERFVPFRKLLPKVAAVVHQAGIGTSAQCLAAGIPQVVVPELYNQPDTAIRLERLGVAHVIQPRRFTVSRLRAGLNAILESRDTKSACAEIASRMVDSKPLPEICRLIEELVPSATD